MNNDSFQDSLFEDPLGLRFRHCREKQRMSLESVAQQLKLPVAILEAIEKEDWSRLGAPIFVRSYVGSYAKFLGLPATLADDVVRGKAAPPLVHVGAPPTRRSYDRSVMSLAYVAMSFGINYAFAGRSFRLWLIDGGYHTLQFTLYGLILGLWH